jgi:hypothetical protein
MKARTFVALAVLAIALVAGRQAASAHHAFAAEFDRDKPIALVGVLTKVQWVNPHSWIYVDVKGPDGKVTNWAFEFGPPNALLRRGVRKADFPLGVEVKVEGFLAKNGQPVANASNVTLADGRRLFAGSATTPGGGDADDTQR